MKFNEKQICSILLILLIGISSISATSLSIKSRRNKRIKRTLKNEDHPKESKILQAINFIQKGQDMAFFILGFISVWVPGAETVYLAIKNTIKFFKPCYKTIKTAWAYYSTPSKPETETEVEIDPAKKAEKEAKLAEDTRKIKAAENAIENSAQTIADKNAYCTETKNHMHQIWLMAVDANFATKPSEKAAYVSSSVTMKAEDYCNIAALSQSNDVQALITKDFGNKENFSESCVLLRNSTDCNTFKPSTKGVWWFIGQVLKYVSIVENAYGCVINLLKLGGKDEATNTPEDPHVKTLSQSAFGSWELSKIFVWQVGQTILHAITLGWWGSTKAIYGIYQLYEKIESMYYKTIYDLPFNLGKLVGMGANIGKNFLLGKRRRKF
jgi:hypothetical protein